MVVVVVGTVVLFVLVGVVEGVFELVVGVADDNSKRIKQW